MISKNFFTKFSKLMLLKILASGLSLIFYYVLAKQLSLSQFGLFSLAMSCLLFCSAFAKQGLEQAVVRFFALSTDIAKFKLYNKVIAYSGISAAIVALLVYLFSTEISLYLFIKIELADLLFYVAILTILQTWLGINSSVLKGQCRPAESLFFSGILTFSISLVLFYVSPPIDGVSALKQFFISVAIACTISFIFVFISFKFPIRNANNLTIDKKGRSTDQIKPLLSTSRTLFLISLSALATQQLSTLILARTASLETIAFFTLALKVTLLMSYPLIVINAITAPKYARLYHQKELHKFKVLAFFTNKILIIIASIAIFVVYMFADKAMLMFDEHYTAAIPIIKILAIGQWFNLATGSVVSMLIMAGFEKQFRTITLILTAFSMILMFILIPNYGVWAAAWITSITMAVKNVVSWYVVYKNIYSKV